MEGSAARNVDRVLSNPILSNAASLGIDVDGLAKQQRIAANAIGAASLGLHHRSLDTANADCRGPFRVSCHSPARTPRSIVLRSR